jgi:hypothetical protein
MDRRRQIKRDTCPRALFTCGGGARSQRTPITSAHSVSLVRSKALSLESSEHREKMMEGSRGAYQAAA